MGIAFYLVSALTIGGALAAVLLKNLVHCALALTVAFLGLALLFLQLDAQFAGFAQILVYIGAVAILVVFAILLTRGSELPQGRCFQQDMAGGAGDCRGGVCGAGLGGAARCAVAAADDACADGDGEADWPGADGPLCVAAGDCCGAADGGAGGRGDCGHAREGGGQDEMARRLRVICWWPRCCLRSGWRER